MKLSTDRSATLEKAEFAKRLKMAISEFDEALLSPTVLAREFNRRSRHSSIGMTTAHKWLSGDAIPAQEKLLLLASWLRVPVQWLRFGEGEVQPALSARAQRRLDKLVSDFSTLTERDKVLVERLIAEMLRVIST